MEPTGPRAGHGPEVPFVMDLQHFAAMRTPRVQAEGLHPQGPTAFGTRSALIPRHPHDFLGQVGEDQSRADADAEIPSRRSIGLTGHQQERDDGQQQAQCRLPLSEAIPH